MEYDPFRHVAYHLFQAKRWKDLYGLVQDVRWHRDSHAHDPNGILYTNDMELAHQAARNSGVEGLAALVSLSLVASQTTSATFARLPLEGLECLVRVDPTSADMVAEHISRTLAPSEQARAYLAIASALRAVGITDKAYTLARRALAIPIAEPTAKALIFARAGEILAQVGDEGEAAQLLEAAFHALGCDTPRWWDRDVNTAVALLMTRLGHWEQARTYLRLILDDWKEGKGDAASQETEKTSDLLAIGSALHHAREPDLANRYIDAAIRNIGRKKQPPPWTWSDWEHEHTWRLAEAIRILVDIGQRETAQSLKAQLLSSARALVDSRIGETTNRLTVLCSASLALVRLGDDRLGGSLLKQAVELAQSASISDMMPFREMMGLLAGTIKERLGLQVIGPRRHLVELFFVPYRARNIALIQLAGALAQAGAHQTAHQAFCELLSEASEAREKEGFLARLKEFILGLGQTESSWSLSLALPAMIQSREPELIDLVLALINCEGSSNTLCPLALHGQESYRSTCGRDCKVLKLKIPWMLKPFLVARLATIGRYRDAASVLRKSPITLVLASGSKVSEPVIQTVIEKLASAGDKVSEPVMQTVIEKLAFAGDLEGAIALANMVGKLLTGCAVAMFASFALGVALLLLLVFHHILRWVCLCGLTCSALLAGVIAVIAVWGKDSEGFSLGTKLFMQEDALLAIIKGLTRRDQLQLAHRIASKIWGDDAKASAMIQVAEAAALAEDNTLFRTAIDEALRVLTKGMLEQEDRARVLITLSVVFQRLEPNYALQLEGALTSCLKLASEIKKAPIRTSALAAVASSLLLCEKHEVADKVLREVLASARDDAQIRDTVIDWLGKANGVGTLQLLWKLGFAGRDTRMVRALGKAILQGEDLEGFCDLVLFLLRSQPKLILSIIDMLEQATRMLKSAPNHSETKATLREAFTVLAEDFLAEYQRNPEAFWYSPLIRSVPSLAQLGHELGMDSEVLEILQQLNLDALKESTQGFKETHVGSDLDAHANLAQALSELDLPKAKSLSIDTLHAMFRIAHTSGRQVHAWYAINHAIPTLANLGGQKILTEAWKYIRQSESAANSMQTERAMINDYEALLR